MNQLGNIIQKLRKGKGMSQEQLAKGSNTPYTTLTKIESGVIKNPSVYTIAKIAEALGSNIDSLIKGNIK